MPWSGELADGDVLVAACGGKDSRDNGSSNSWRCDTGGTGGGAGLDAAGSAEVREALGYVDGRPASPSPACRPISTASQAA